MNEVRLRIKLESKRGAKEIDSEGLELLQDEEEGYYKAEKDMERELSLPSSR